MNVNAANGLRRSGKSMLKCEDLVGKRILAVDEKFYVTDHGMRRAM